MLIKPVMPYVNDFIGHVFFYAEHIAAAHIENGRFHVHIEAAKTAGEENNKEDNTPSSSKKDNSITEDCVFLVTDETLLCNSTNFSYVPVKNDAAVYSEAEKNYPPPRC